MKTALVAIAVPKDGRYWITGIFADDKQGQKDAGDSMIRGMESREVETGLVMRFPFGRTFTFSEAETVIRLTK